MPVCMIAFGSRDHLRARAPSLGRRTASTKPSRGDNRPVQPQRAKAVLAVTSPRQWGDSSLGLTWQAATILSILVPAAARASLGGHPSGGILRVTARRR